MPILDLPFWEAECLRFLTAQPTTDVAHDLGHIQRVVKTAKNLAEQENAALEVVVPAAWLHDCVSVPKNSPLRTTASQLAAAEATRFLTQIGYPEKWHQSIYHAIEAHSFSANLAPRTVEAKVVQDADRLDAIGAVGLGRCLMLGGSFGSQLYHPLDPFCQNRPPEDTQYVVDHFFAKLLKLKDLMQTPSGKKEATLRTQFLQSFLDQLALELPGQAAK